MTFVSPTLYYKVSILFTTLITECVRFSLILTLWKKYNNNKQTKRKWYDTLIIRVLFSIFQKIGNNIILGEKSHEMSAMFLQEMFFGSKNTSSSEKRQNVKLGNCFSRRHMEMYVSLYSTTRYLDYSGWVLWFHVGCPCFRPSVCRPSVFSFLDDIFSNVNGFSRNMSMDFHETWYVH